MRGVKLDSAASVALRLNAARATRSDSPGVEHALAADVDSVLEHVEHLASTSTASTPWAGSDSST